MLTKDNAKLRTRLIKAPVRAGDKIVKVDTRTVYTLESWEYHSPTSATLYVARGVPKRRKLSKTMATLDDFGLEIYADDDPYDALYAALVKSGARCMSQSHMQQYVVPHMLEFWLVHDRLVIVQHWDQGGWDAYVQIREHQTDKAIAEVLGQTPAA